MLTGFRIKLLLLCAALLLPCLRVVAQDHDYTLALRSVALADALERFVDATGAAVSYDPGLVRGRTASCAAEKVPAEAVLRCILRDTGLDFFRLSSGTYVLTEDAEVEPEHGYLAGSVVDHDTGRPLADSHVLLADAGVTAVTNRSGHFSFPSLLPGRYVLTISHLGYRTYRDTLFVSPREQVSTEAALRSETIFITPVIVQGIQHRPPSESVASPTASAAAAPIGHPTVDRAVAYRQVQSLPGVRLNDVTADVHLQGGDAGAHQVRLDGVPVFLPRSIAGLVGPFSSFALDQITAHKTGFGAGHGSQLGGVLLGEHALAGVNDVDLQVDPYSANGRIRLSSDSDAAGEMSAMVAGRIGLWDVAAPARLQSTLDAWSRPDPFLVLAPLADEGAPSIGGTSDILRSPVHPTLNYADVHAAARARFSPLRSLEASVYQGRQRLNGGVLAGPVAQRLQTFTSSEFTAVDDYDWINTLGQMRYDAVLGSRTLAGLQVRGSRYRLRHAYETIDSLHVVIDESSARLDGVTTSPGLDGNHVSIVAMEGTVDHAFGNHQMQLGLEAARTESRFDLGSVYFEAGRGSPFTEDGAQVVGESGFDNMTRASVRNASGLWTLAGYGSNRIRLGSGLELEAGLRATYLHARQTVYAEPRAAVRIDRSSGPLGAWSARTSAGLYRQFMNQIDVSKLNAGALLPSVRVWLPVDASVRPPTAYHLAQELLVRPLRGWTIWAEGFFRYEPHHLATTYAPANRTEFLTGRRRQSEFLASVRGRAYGADLALRHEGERVRVEVGYAYEDATRRGPDLFDGRSHPVPWSEPHRVELAADWMPYSRVSFTARWKGVWLRPWGFRQAYYDYFGHDPDTRLHAPYDLGRPEDHVLPPLYQLDVGFAYTQPIGAARLQVRADVMNVLNRDNVMDWRLDRDASGWRRTERTLYPIMPAWAVRLSW